MVYLILSEKGLTDLKAEFGNSENSYWITEDILPKAKAEKYWKQKVNLTVISGKINKRNTKEIENILIDIEEHHPGETIWVEE